jgi:hypothetical protein
MRLLSLDSSVCLDSLPGSGWFQAMWIRCCMNWTQQIRQGTENESGNFTTDKSSGYRQTIS